MNRTDIVLLISAKLCNPNGDPDGDNRPRTTPDTGTGIITKGCISRKIRNFIQSKFGQEKGYDIYVKENTVLGRTRLNALSDAKLPAPTEENKGKVNEQGQKVLLEKYFDLRAFGGVLTGNKTVNCGQVRGPVQITMLESIDPITTMDLAITRCAAETPEEQEKSLDGSAKTMGSYKALNFALYKGVISINPILAKETGFSKEDFERLKVALKNLFAIDTSSARPAGSMTVEGLYMFEHESEYGNEQTAKLLRRVTANKTQEVPTDIQNYEISINKDNLPVGISYSQLL